MSNNVFFPERPDVSPKIYGYIDSGYPNFIKIGYTAGSVAERVKQQYPTLRPNDIPYTIVLEENAYRDDGTIFYDHDVFRELEKRGIERVKDKDGKPTEWFRTEPCKITGDQCDLTPFRLAIKAVATREEETNRLHSFAMRPEQHEAVDKTCKLFKEWAVKYPNAKPHFLWNAKMRFGKTFTTYEFAKAMEYKKVLVLTFKPAVEESWHDDLMSHVDFEGWQFVSKHQGISPEQIDKSRPFVCFGSFQDYLGHDKATGGIKPKNEWVHTTKWDLIVLDEYHYGAWREKAIALTNEEANIDSEDKYYEELEKDGNINSDIADLETFMPITTRGYLYLSGTPFRALNSGEFAEDQIFSWTYSDEQRAKENWDDSKGKNPYAALPRMVMMTYQLPDYITQVAKSGEFDEFDLNTFFKADGKGKLAKFVYEAEVQKWLDIIQGKLQETTIDNLKLGAKKPPFPFSDTRLKSILSHTIWFLPNVASCDAMRNLIRRENSNNVWLKNNFNFIYAYGNNSGVGIEAYKFARSRMSFWSNLGEHANDYKNTLESRSITLTCGKLTTGVTIPEWTGIFMLRNLKSPETYFQAAFRVQSPWTIKNVDGLHPNEETIIKKECYIFDFAPNRALKQLADYSCRLNTTEPNSEKKVAEFISFLPVLAYDGSTMTRIDAGGILDIVLSGTTATLLARRWESALLVNVDNATLYRLINNKEAYEAVMRIEGFRKLGDNFLETIINQSEALKKTKKELSEQAEVTKQEKQKLTDAEKEEKSKRKQVQEKLIKFATRIPVFMFLTDFREATLRDVITKIDSELFKKVTGLTVRDFELLVSIGLFNEGLMNDAVFKFRRYEDDSLSYTGINKHEGEQIGGWSTSLQRQEFVNMD
jgi:superfamily II DNA or RNA helicase